MRYFLIIVLANLLFPYAAYSHTPDWVIEFRRFAEYSRFLLGQASLDVLERDGVGNCKAYAEKMAKIAVSHKCKSVEVCILHKKGTDDKYYAVCVVRDGEEFWFSSVASWGVVVERIKKKEDLLNQIDKSVFGFGIGEWEFCDNGQCYKRP